MVLQGRATTLAASMAAMTYHTECVARGNRTAWIVADMPFGSYQESPALALRHATRLMQAGAHMVKLEGGGWTAPTVEFLAERGIPVCGHLGFTPQSVQEAMLTPCVAIGGITAQNCRPLVAAGADFMLIEMVPAALARELTGSLAVPVIGIGAGVGCGGQVLVLHDLLGLTLEVTPRFAKNFLIGAAGIEDAVRRYVADVKAGRFPDDSLHGF